jgi:hypothetical protein
VTGLPPLPPGTSSRLPIDVFDDRGRSVAAVFADPVEPDPDPADTEHRTVAFVVGELGPGRYSLRARAGDGLAEATVLLDEGETVEVTLRARAAVSLQVTLAPPLVASAPRDPRTGDAAGRVEIDLRDASGRRIERATIPRPTDPALFVVPPGTYELRAFGDWFGTRRMTIDVPRGTRAIERILE